MGNLFSHPDGQGAFDQSGWLEDANAPGSVHLQALKVQDFGVYRVSLRAPGAKAVFGPRRNLVCQEPGDEDIQFLTHLTPYIPSMHNAGEVNTDLSLFVSACGAEIPECRAEPCKARTVFIAGDSTVADQYAGRDYCPRSSYCGWGQMLGAYLMEDAVCNMAHSGLTARCFMEDGHWGIVKERMQKGDLCLIQFGHNDQKRYYLRADGQYASYLEKLSRLVLDLGGQPVLISPLSRVPSRDETGYFDLLEAHARAVQALAKRLKLPFIDLHEYSFQLFCGMGDKCRALFRDMTHLNDPGAFHIAGFIAKEISCLGLANCICAKEGIVQTDERAPQHTPAPQPLPVSYVDLDGVPDPSVVYRGVQSGLLDPCVMHMHPFEPICRAAFIQLLFKAARLPSEPTHGQKPYPDVDAREFDAGFAAACKKRGLLDGALYRPGEGITAQEAVEILRRAGLEATLSAPGPLTRYGAVALLLEAMERRR